MEALMLSMMAWINLHTEYNMQVTLPNIVFVEESLLCDAYGIASPAICEVTQLKGFYNKSKTIYLNINFDADIAEHRSYLLHELVHYVQWQNGKNQSNFCWGKLEVEAYHLQDDWRYQHSVSKATDPFKLVMLEAACDD